MGQGQETLLDETQWEQGGGAAPAPETSRLEPRRLECESTISGSALTTVRGVAASDETSWTTQVTDGGMAEDAEPPKMGGRDEDPMAPVIPTGEEENEAPQQSQENG
jgi:hypothetical protein